MDAKELGAFIADVRKEKEMTQSELAERLHVTKSAISKWERGAGLPDINMLEPLAETLEVSIIELMKHRKMSQKEILETDAAAAVKEMTVQFEEEKKLGIGSWVILVVVIALVLSCPHYFWADEKDLGGGFFWTMLFWGIGFFLPVIALFVRKYVQILSLGSFFCCGMALVNELFYTAHKVAIRDYGAIEDTAGGVLRISIYGLRMIVILNLLAYFFSDKENQKSLAQFFINIWNGISRAVLGLMSKF